MLRAKQKLFKWFRMREEEKDALNREQEIRQNMAALLNTILNSQESDDVKALQIAEIFRRGNEVFNKRDLSLWERTKASLRTLKGTIFRIAGGFGLGALAAGLAASGGVWIIPAIGLAGAAILLRYIGSQATTQQITHMILARDKLKKNNNSPEDLARKLALHVMYNRPTTYKRNEEDRNNFLRRARELVARAPLLAQNGDAGTAIVNEQIRAAEKRRFLRIWENVGGALLTVATSLKEIGMIAQKIGNWIHGKPEPVPPAPADGADTLLMGDSGTATLDSTNALRDTASTAHPTTTAGDTLGNLAGDGAHVSQLVVQHLGSGVDVYKQGDDVVKMVIQVNEKEGFWHVAEKIVGSMGHGSASDGVKNTIVDAIKDWMVRVKTAGHLNTPEVYPLRGELGFKHPGEVILEGRELKKVLDFLNSLHSQSLSPEEVVKAAKEVFGNVLYGAEEVARGVVVSNR